MKESKVNSEIVASIRKIGGWAYKIPDQRATSWNPEMPAFVTPKPCDILACIGGAFVAIETKQIKEWKAFGPKALRPSQIKNLSAIAESGGKALVALNVRTAKENRLIFFNYEDFSKLEKSIGKKDLEVLPFIKGHKGVFDLEDFQTVVINLRVLHAWTELYTDGILE